jgi:hypothetical protein
MTLVLMRSMSIWIELKKPLGLSHWGFLFHGSFGPCWSSGPSRRLDSLRKAQDWDSSLTSRVSAAAKKKADMMISAFLDDMPVYKIHTFSEGRFTEQRLEEVLSRVQ